MKACARVLLFNFIVCSFLCGYAVASDETGSTEAEPASQTDADSNFALDDLFEALEQETQIATRTKLNIDYVPGMVSVIHGGDALSRGAKNVYEALGLIPGIDLALSSDGSQVVVVRGLGNVFASGKIKALLNGVPFNATLSALTYLYAMPTEQVDRVEFIHGPGSTVHGEYAFSGVLNVITRKGITQTNLSVGSHNQRLLNLALHEKLDASGVVLDLNMAGFRTDGANVQTGPDSLNGTPMQAISNAPGKTNEEEEVDSVLFNADLKGFTFSAQYLKRAFGDHFGINDVLADSEGIQRTNTMQSYVLAREVKWGEKSSSRFNLGWRHFELDSNKLTLFPPGFRNSFQESGVLGSVHYEEADTFFGADFESNAYDGHQLVLGLEYHKIVQGDTWVKRNINPSNLQEVPYQKETGADNWMAEGLKREVVSVYFQDELTITDQFSVNAGLRLDDYDDTGTTDSPRLALIYKLNSHHTVKFQAARAFRPPTFLEQYSQNNLVVNGNEDLDPEYVENYELGYIFHDVDMVVRITAFQAHLKKLINIDTQTQTYRNANEASVSGLETLLEYRINSQWRLDGTWSAVHSHDEATDHEFGGVAHALLDLGVQYVPVTDYMLNLQFASVGERTRSAEDGREELDGYNTLDLVLNVNNLAYKGLDLRVGVKNMTDADVRYPAAAGTYAEDYPRDGRNWWLQLGYEF